MSAHSSSPNVQRDQPGPTFYARLIAPGVLGVLGFFWATGLRVALAGDAYDRVWAVLLAAHYVVIAAVGFAATRRRKLTCAATVAILAGYGVWGFAAFALPRFTASMALLYAIGLTTAWATVALVVLLHRDDPRGGETTMDTLRRHVGDVRRLDSIRTVDGRVTAQLTLEPGVTVGSLKPEALASLVAAPPGGARIIPDTHDAGRALAEIEPVDVNAEPRIWPGPSRPQGGSLSRHPAMCGPQLAVYLAGDAAARRNMSHIKMVGMSGAGKSEAIRLLLLEAMSIGGDQFEYDYLDPRKAAQQPRWVLDGARVVATTKASVAQALQELRDVEVPRRTKHLGERGHDQWVDGCGLKFRLVVLDEIAAVAQDIERLLTDLGETLRSLGVQLLVGLQRASGGRFPTDARAQFGTEWCFGVDNADSAAMGLPESALDQGAAPDMWGNRFPGMCYYVGPGVPEDEYSRKRRTWSPNRARMEQWAQQLIGARVSASVPPVLARASTPVLASPYASGARPVVGHGGMEGIEASEAGYSEACLPDVTEACLPDASGEARLAADTRALLAEAGEADGEAWDGEAGEAIAAGNAAIDGATRADMGPVDHGRTIEPLDGEPGMTLRLAPRMPDLDARRLARRMLCRLAESGVSEFEVSDLGAEIIAATGMSASWLSKWLGIWTESHATHGPAIIRRVSARGRFAFLPSARGEHDA